MLGACSTDRVHEHSAARGSYDAKGDTTLIDRTWPEATDLQRQFLQAFVDGIEGKHKTTGESDEVLRHLNSWNDFTEAELRVSSDDSEEYEFIFRVASRPGCRFGFRMFVAKTQGDASEAGPPRTEASISVANLQELIMAWGLPDDCSPGAITWLEFE